MRLRGQTLLVLGVAVAVLIVLARIIWGSPLVARVRTEMFTNGGGGGGGAKAAPINTMTECPPGSTMYMYEGAAYCCGGIISIDADSVTDTCRPATSAPGAAAPLFCTLGASTAEGIPNCVETGAGLMQALGEQLCPTEMPNLVSPRQPAGAPRKCCAGLPNADYSDCQNPAEKSCAITANAKWLMEPQSCQWIKFYDENKDCPTGMTSVQGPGHGPIEGTTMFGCLNQSAGAFCYSKALVDQLTAMGYDASSLSVCTPTSGTPAATAASTSSSS
jgi:hypothetical protein